MAAFKKGIEDCRDLSFPQVLSNLFVQDVELLVAVPFLKIYEKLIGGTELGNCFD